MIGPSKSWYENWGSGKTYLQLPIDKQKMDGVIEEWEMNNIELWAK